MKMFNLNFKKQTWETVSYICFRTAYALYPVHMHQTSYNSIDLGDVWGNIFMEISCAEINLLCWKNKSDGSFFLFFFLNKDIYGLLLPMDGWCCGLHRVSFTPCPSKSIMQQPCSEAAQQSLFLFVSFSQSPKGTFGCLVAFHTTWWENFTSFF